MLNCIKCGCESAVVPWFCRYITLCRMCCIRCYSENQRPLDGVDANDEITEREAYHIFLTDTDLVHVEPLVARCPHRVAKVFSKYVLYTAAYALYGEYVSHLWQRPVLPDGSFAERVQHINEHLTPDIQLRVDPKGDAQLRVKQRPGGLWLSVGRFNSENLDTKLPKDMQTLWAEHVHIDMTQLPNHRILERSRTGILFGNSKRSKQLWVYLTIPLSLVFDPAGVQDFVRDYLSRLDDSLLQTNTDKLWRECNGASKPLPIPVVRTRRTGPVIVPWRNDVKLSRCLKFWALCDDRSEEDIDTFAAYPPLLRAVASDTQRILDIWDLLRDTWSYWVTATDESQALVWITGVDKPIKFRLSNISGLLYDAVAHGWSNMYGMTLTPVFKKTGMCCEEPNLPGRDDLPVPGTTKIALWECDSVRFELAPALSGGDYQLMACDDACAVATLSRASEVAPETWQRVFQENRPCIFVHTITCAEIGFPSARELRRILRSLDPYTLTDSETMTIVKRRSEYTNFMSHVKILGADEVELVLQCKGLDLLVQSSTQFHTRARWLYALQFPAINLVHRPIQRSILPFDVVEQIAKRVPLRCVVNMHDDFIEARLACTSAEDDRDTDGNVDWTALTAIEGDE